MDDEAHENHVSRCDLSDQDGHDRHHRQENESGGRKAETCRGCGPTEHLLREERYKIRYRVEEKPHHKHRDDGEGEVAVLEYAEINNRMLLLQLPPDERG